MAIKLLKFRFENFHSYAGPAGLDLTVKRGKVASDWFRPATSESDAISVMAVLGANGSGKTGMLKALAFTRWFIVDSFVGATPDSPIAVTAHQLRLNEPSSFEVEFLLDDKHFRYEFSCSLNSVIREALYVRESRFGYVFEREGSGEEGQLKLKQPLFPFAREQKRSVRPNASLLATAAQFAVPIADSITAAWRSDVSTNLTIAGVQPAQFRVLDAAMHFHQSPADHAVMTSLLKGWDLGLSAVPLTPLEFREGPESEPVQMWMPVGAHDAGTSSFSLPFTMESTGTQSAFVLLSHLLPVLRNGGVAVIDSLDNDLHPHMVDAILQLFASPSDNPHGAQLLFTAHAAHVMNSFRKPQITFVEKDEHCNSTSYRMDQLQGVRNDEAFSARYLAGAYGAIPNL